MSTKKENLPFSSELLVPGNFADTFLQCGGNTNDNFQCENEDHVLSGDGKIYKCSNKTWTEVNSNSIPKCIDRNKDFATRYNSFYEYEDFIYFAYKEENDRISTNKNEHFCKYPHDDYYNKADRCIMEGGTPLPYAMCDDGHKETLYITVHGDEENYLHNVKFYYTNLNIETNQEINVAKEQTHYYELNVDPSSKREILIVANGYPKTKINVGNLYNSLNPNVTIRLKKSNTTDSTTQTQVANSQGSFKIVDGKTGSDISGVTIYTNNKGNPDKLIGTSDQNGNFTPDNTNKVKGGVVLVHDGYKRTIYTYKNFPINGVFSMTPCSTTSRNPTTPQTTQLQYDKCETVYVLPSISPEPLPVCNNDPKKITRTPTQTISQLAQIPPAEIILAPQNDTSEAACKYTGGTYTDNQCTCDLDNKHLVAYTDSAAREICRCADGYHRTGDPVCINEDEIPVYEATGPCIPANDYEIQIVPDKIGMQRDAEDAYRNEYDNAQSWANKGTTALSTLMTGEGAMMAARAIAERKADNEAEREMAEYVSTMKCEYGGGQSVKLGDTETLPGGNELANYYAEYKQLADKLKATKAALNLRPGIEAEVLYDRAETGLYQYQTAERQSGGFTSLSRALMNPEGADATAWNAQRAETNRDLLIGGTLATTGLVGSYIANRAINKDHVKKYKELEEKFREIKTMIERRYPEAFIFTEPEIQQQESPTITETVVQESEPSVTVTPQLPKLNPFKDNYLFDSGKWVLKSTHSALDEYITYIVDTFKDEKYLNSKICINVDGYTDWIPPKPGFVSNKVLSERRAQAVSDYIKTKTGDISNHIRDITPTGHGDEQCNKAIYKTEEELQTCRRVEINIRDCSDL